MSRVKHRMHNDAYLLKSKDEESGQGERCLDHVCERVQVLL